MQTASGTALDNWINWIVVLPAPGSKFGGWAASTNTGRTSITGVAPHGVFVADAGQVTSDVVLGFGIGRGDWVPVGLPGAPAVPSLAPLPALSPPASYSWMDAYTGQGNELNDDSSVTRSGGPYAVLGSCYNAAAMRIGMAQPTPAGHGPLRITISGHTIGAITCDGQQHELAVPRSLLRHLGVLIGIDSSMLTSWQVDFGRAH